eukprot:806458_1
MLLYHLIMQQTQSILMLNMYLIKDRDRRKIIVHDIETLYLCHLHSEIIDNHMHSDIHTFNNYFDDVENEINELNIVNHPLPKYVRDYSNFNDASNITPLNYMNNIIKNKSIIECNTTDKRILM